MSAEQLANPEDYWVLHPDYDHIPPLVTQDGDVDAVGTAHGRTIPMIGTIRPPVYDVSLHPFDGGNTRIYADDADEIMAVICGKPYRDQLNRCHQLSADYQLLNDDNDPDGSKRLEADGQFALEVGLLSYIRGTFAHKARAVAQRIINEKAREDGAWDKLSDEEKDVLTRAADAESDTAPVGVLEEAEITEANPDGTTDTFTVTRGAWRSNHVPLVINEIDYFPWQEIPRPLSSTTVTTVAEDGEPEQTFQDTISELNLAVIPVDDSHDLLFRLRELGVINMAIRPDYAVSEPFRDWYADFTKRRVERNRQNAAAKEKDENQPEA